MFIEFQYPLQAPITNSDKVILAGNVSTRNGSGEGSISATFHRLASEKSWYQFTSSFGNGLSMGSTVYRKLSPRTFADMSGKTKTCFWKFQEWFEMWNFRQPTVQPGWFQTVFLHNDGQQSDNQDKGIPHLLYQLVGQFVHKWGWSGVGPGSGGIGNVHFECTRGGTIPIFVLHSSRFTHISALRRWLIPTTEHP